VEPILDYDTFYRFGDFSHDVTRSRSLLQALLGKHPVPRGGLVLDVGAGTGFHTRLLATFGLRVLGTDLSKVAVGKAVSEDKERARFVVADCRDLPFRSRSVGCVFSLALTLFSNVDDLERTRAAVDEILRVLEFGGVLYLLWSSDLSGQRRFWPTGGSWMHYTRAQWATFLSSFEGAELVATYVGYNRSFPLLRRLALTPSASLLTAALTRVTGHRALLICVVRRTVAGGYQACGHARTPGASGQFG
jgi:SAM-dependent methyltransferase